MGSGQGSWGTPLMLREANSASVALDGCGAGAGTGFSHWANSEKQRNTAERSGFQTVASQLLYWRPLGRLGWLAEPPLQGTYLWSRPGAPPRGPPFVAYPRPFWGYHPKEQLEYLGS